MQYTDKDFLHTRNDNVAFKGILRNQLFDFASFGTVADKIPYEINAVVPENLRRFNRHIEALDGGKSAAGADNGFIGFED